MSTNTKAISDETIKRLFEDMASSPVDDVTIISRPQLEVLQSALANAAKAIHDAVMAERDKHAWQPIHTAPKDGTAVDLWGVNHLHYAKSGRRATDVMWGPVRDWMGNERDDWQHGQGEDFEPTHWCSRPAAPKSEG